MPTEWHQRWHWKGASVECWAPLTHRGRFRVSSTTLSRFPIKNRNPSIKHVPIVCSCGASSRRFQAECQARVPATFLSRDVLYPFTDLFSLMIVLLGTKCRIGKVKSELEVGSKIKWTLNTQVGFYRSEGGNASECTRVRVKGGGACIFYIRGGVAIGLKRR